MSIFAPALRSVAVGAGKVEGIAVVMPELADVRLGKDVEDAAEGVENDVEDAADCDKDDVEGIASGAEDEELELKRKHSSPSQSYPIGQQVEGPQPGNSPVSWVVCSGFVGNAVALRNSR